MCQCNQIQVLLLIWTTSRTVSQTSNKIYSRFQLIRLKSMLTELNQLVLHLLDSKKTLKEIIDPIYLIMMFANTLDSQSRQIYQQGFSSNSNSLFLVQFKIMNNKENTTNSSLRCSNKINSMDNNILLLLSHKSLVKFLDKQCSNSLWLVWCHLWCKFQLHNFLIIYLTLKRVRVIKKVKCPRMGQTLLLLLNQYLVI